MSKFLLIAVLLFGFWLLLRRSRPKPIAHPGEAEARAVLGVGAGADEDAIRAAHRRLITALHPDKGGSADLTRQINAARDVLLRR